MTGNSIEDHADQQLPAKQPKLEHKINKQQQLDSTQQLKEKASQNGKIQFEKPQIFGPMKMDLISQGAEARVWSGIMFGKSVIIKHRFSKKYRHPTLDKTLTHARLKQEVRGMMKARKVGVRTPVVYLVDLDYACICMERVEGKMLKLLIDDQNQDAEAMEKLLIEVGNTIAKLHDNGIVHGDLTTSNLMVRDNGELVVIDFGLSSNSNLSEDKAVDLYVLERAFVSAHSDRPELFEKVKEAYKANSKLWCPTLNKFAEVRMRGRKRAMVG